MQKNENHTRYVDSFTDGLCYFSNVDQRVLTRTSSKTSSPLPHFVIFQLFPTTHPLYLSWGQVPPCSCLRTTMLLGVADMLTYFFF